MYTLTYARLSTTSKSDESSPGKLNGRQGRQQSFPANISATSFVFFVIFCGCFWGFRGFPQIFFLDRINKIYKIGISVFAQFVFVVGQACRLPLQSSGDLIFIRALANLKL